MPVSLAELQVSVGIDDAALKEGLQRDQELLQEFAAREFAPIRLVLDDRAFQEQITGARNQIGNLTGVALKVSLDTSAAREGAREITDALTRLSAVTAQPRVTLGVAEFQQQVASLLGQLEGLSERRATIPIDLSIAPALEHLAVLEARIVQVEQRAAQIPLGGGVAPIPGMPELAPAPVREAAPVVPEPLQAVAAPPLDVDISRVNGKVQQAREELLSYGNTEVQAKADLDVSAAEANLGRIETEAKTAAATPIRQAVEVDMDRLREGLAQGLSFEQATRAAIQQPMEITADTADLDRKLQTATERLSAFAARMANVRANLDDSQFQERLQGDEAALSDLAGRQVSVHVSGEAAEFERTRTQIERELTEMSGQRVKIVVEADLTQARSEVETIASRAQAARIALDDSQLQERIAQDTGRLAEIAGKPVTVHVGAEGSEFERVRRQTEAELTALTGRKVTVELDADPGGLDRKLAEANARVTAFAERMAQARADLDPTALNEKVAAAEELLTRLRGETVEIKIGAQAAEFEQVRSQLTREIEAMSGQKVEVGVVAEPGAAAAPAGGSGFQVAGLLTGAYALQQLTGRAGEAGKAALDADVRWDAFQRQLTSFAGSSAAAGRQLQQLAVDAEAPGIKFEDLIAGVRRLEAAGMGFDQARQTLLAWGQAAAMVSKDGTANLDRISQALDRFLARGQVTSAGGGVTRLATQIPEIGQMMQVGFGTTDPKLISGAGVTADQFVGILTQAFQTRLPRFETGVRDELKAIEQRLFTVQADIGHALEPVRLDALETILSGVERLRAGFDTLPEPTQHFVAALAGITGALSSAAVPLAAATLGITALTGALGGPAVLAFGAVTAALVALGAAFVTDLGGVREIAASAADSVGQALLPAWKAFVDWEKENLPLVQQIAANVTDGIRNLWQSLSPDLVRFASAGWDEVKTVFGGAMDALGEVLHAGLQAMTGDWNGAFASLSGAVEKAFSTYAQTIVEKTPALLSATGNLAAAILDGLQHAFDNWGLSLHRGLVAEFESIVTDIEGAFKKLPARIAEDAKNAMEFWKHPTAAPAAPAVGMGDLRALEATMPEPQMPAVPKPDMDAWMQARTAVFDALTGMGDKARTTFDGINAAAEAAANKTAEAFQKAMQRAEADVAKLLHPEDQTIELRIQHPDFSPQQINALAGLENAKKAIGEASQASKEFDSLLKGQKDKFQELQDQIGSVYGGFNASLVPLTKANDLVQKHAALWAKATAGIKEAQAAGASAPVMPGTANAAIAATLGMQIAHDPRVLSTCAEFVSNSLRAAGIEIPKTLSASGLVRELKGMGAQELPIQQAQRGDVIYYQGPQYGARQAGGRRSGSHVAIAAGNDMLRQSSDGLVKLEPIYDKLHAHVLRLTGEHRDLASAVGLVGPGVDQMGAKFAQFQAVSGKVQAAEVMLKIAQGAAAAAKAIEMAGATSEAARIKIEMFGSATAKLTPQQEQGVQVEARLRDLARLTESGSQLRLAFLLASAGTDTERLALEKLGQGFQSLEPWAKSFIQRQAEMKEAATAAGAIRDLGTQIAAANAPTREQAIALELLKQPFETLPPRIQAFVQQIVAMKRELSDTTPITKLEDAAKALAQQNQLAALSMQKRLLQETGQPVPANLNANIFAGQQGPGPSVEAMQAQLEQIQETRGRIDAVTREPISLNVDPQTALPLIQLQQPISKTIELVARLQAIFAGGVSEKVKDDIAATGKASDAAIQEFTKLGQGVDEAASRYVQAQNKMALALAARDVAAARRQGPGAETAARSRLDLLQHEASFQETATKFPGAIDQTALLPMFAAVAAGLAPIGAAALATGGDLGKLGQSWIALAQIMQIANIESATAALNRQEAAAKKEAETTDKLQSRLGTLGQEFSDVTMRTSTHAQALAKLEAEMGGFTDAQKVLADQIINQTLRLDKMKEFADGMRSIFASALEGIGGGFKGLFQSIAVDFEQLLMKMASEYVSSQFVSLIMRTFGGSIGGILGGLAGATSGGGGGGGDAANSFAMAAGGAFAGILGSSAGATMPAAAGDWASGLGDALSGLLPGLAGGGEVQANQPVVVGEREPELFVPQTSGTVLNSQEIARALAGQGGDTHNYTFNYTLPNVRDTQTFRQNQAATVADALRHAELQKKRNGG